MKPFDARLLRYARGILPLLSWGTFLALARAVAILIWAWSIAHLIAWAAKPLMTFDWSVTFQGQVFEGLEDHVKLWVGLAITAVVVRSGATWLMSVVAERGAARIKDELRNSALKHIEQLGPEWIAKESEAKVTLRLSRGLDALDAYFSQYVPQLLLTITVTPLLTIALIWADLLSAIIVIIVFPVIPVFMILIGLATKSAQEKQWRALTQLSNTYLDVVRGLRTLKLFRREKRQVERVAKVTEAYRSRTMQVLRVTFLSGFVLDLAGTFSVALVAVTVGTRLVEGAFPLALALFVLLLVPEVFIPIRQVGAAFHASSEGLAAAEDVFSILETTPERPVQLSTHADLAHSDLEHTLQDGSLIKLKNVQVSRSDAPLAEPLTLGVMPGEIVAIAGPSGVGKTTILSAILGFVKYSGEIIVTEYAWSGQRAGLLRGSVAENVGLGDDTIDKHLVRKALDAAYMPHLDAETLLGNSGEGLSGGQAQRVALARALYRMWSKDAKLLILDEPTSALDVHTEARIVETLKKLSAQGTGVLLVSHRPAVLEAAHRVQRMREVQLA